MFSFLKLWNQDLNSWNSSPTFVLENAISPLPSLSKDDGMPFSSPDLSQIIQVKPGVRYMNSSFARGFLSWNKSVTVFHLSFWKRVTFFLLLIWILTPAAVFPAKLFSRKKYSLHCKNTEGHKNNKNFFTIFPNIFKRTITSLTVVIRLGSQILVITPRENASDWPEQQSKARPRWHLYKNHCRKRLTCLNKKPICYQNNLPPTSEISSSMESSEAKLELGPLRSRLGLWTPMIGLFF